MKTPQKKIDYQTAHNRVRRSMPPQGLCECSNKATKWSAGMEQICDRCDRLESQHIQIVGKNGYEISPESELKPKYVSQFAKFAVRIADGINELIVSAHGNYHLKIS